MTAERYGLEEAQAEADKMREHIASGQAENYPEAEKLVEGEKGSYNLEANQEFLGAQKVEVTKVDETKPWKPALEVKVTKADGTVVEGLDASTPFFTFKSNKENGPALTVSAEAAGHIDDLHIKAKEAGSQFDYPTLEALFADVSKKLPEGVAEAPGVTAFDMEMGKNMGKEGIASVEELLKDGVLSGGDILAMREVKDLVSELNKSGDEEAKKAFIEKFKKGEIKENDETFEWWAETKLAGELAEKLKALKDIEICQQ